MRLIFLSMLVSFVFLGCAQTVLPTSKPFDKIVILNQSDYIIKKASIHARSTKRKLQCGQIIQQGHCEYKFHKKSNTKNHFTIKWQVNGKTYTHDNITLSKLKIKEGEPVSISINILNDGKFLINQL